MINSSNQTTKPVKVLPETSDRATRLARKHNPFVRSTSALYDPSTQIIKLTSLDQKDFEQARFKPAANLHILELMSHEWRHWQDHIGSLWGQRYLVQWLNALSIGKDRSNPHQYWRIVQATKSSAWFGYDKYFHEIRQTDQIARPWRYNYSSGLGFTAQGRLDESHPIFFVNFQSADGHFIARVPMAVRSLLEVRAMETSLFVEAADAFNGISKEDKDAQLVANALFEKKGFDYIYNANLTEYSVAAHILANSCGLSEIMGSFRLAARLANIVLNLPQSFYARLSNPGPSLGVRHDAFIVRRSFGYAYFLLCNSAPKINFDIRDESLVKAWVNDACRNVGLPTPEEILAGTLNEMTVLEQELVDGAFKARGLELLRYGRGLCQRTWLANSAELMIVQKEAWAANQFPPIFLGDDTLINHSQFFSHSTFANPENWINEVWDLDSWFDTFLGACFRE